MRVAAVGLSGLLLSGCFFDPDIAGDGYLECEKTETCGPGRRCELNLCVPPPWWNEGYSARYQILVESDAASHVPEGSLGELTVGEGGELSLAAVGFGPVVVHADPLAQEQGPTRGLRDARGVMYAMVFQLPAAIDAGATYGDLWLYVQGDSAGPAPAYHSPNDVYHYYDGFDGDALSAEAFRWEGAADIGNGQVVLRDSAWLVSTDSFRDSEVSVDLQLYGAGCTRFGVGLGARGTPQSLDPPYAMFVCDENGVVRHEVLASAGSAVEVEGEAFPADGLFHRFTVAVAGAAIEFWVDGARTAAWSPATSLADTELHLHLYTRDCDMRVDSARAAPRAAVAPAIRLGPRVEWYP